MNATTVCGLAVPFFETVPVPNGRPGRQRFIPGSFDRAIAHNRVELLIGHATSSPVIGSTADRSLRLFEGEAGLFFRFTAQGAIGRHVLTLTAAGAYGGVSAAYRRATSTFADSNGLESFLEVDLVEISLVPRHTRPAFASTWVRAMSAAEAWVLEQAATVRVTMLTDHPVSYGGRDFHFQFGVSYLAPAWLARTMVSKGLARPFEEQSR